MDADARWWNRSGYEPTSMFGYPEVSLVTTYSLSLGRSFEERKTWVRIIRITTTWAARLSPLVNTIHILRRRNVRRGNSDVIHLVCFRSHCGCLVYVRRKFQSVITSVGIPQPRHHAR